MTWEQKLHALNALSGNTGGCSLHMLAPGVWYFHMPEINRRERGGTGGGFRGYSPSPEQAVEDSWQWAVDEKYALQKGFDSAAKFYEWNGFMWAEISREAAFAKKGMK